MALTACTRIFLVNVKTKEVVREFIGADMLSRHFDEAPNVARCTNVNLATTGRSEVDMDDHIASLTPYLGLNPAISALYA